MMMSESCLNVVHCNCQKAYTAMCDLGEWLCERRVSVALQQEPYVRFGRVTGLPVSMNVIACESESIKAAVVVSDLSLDVMCVRECTNEFGMCVCVDKGGLWRVICGVHLLPVNGIVCLRNCVRLGARKWDCGRVILVIGGCV